MKWKLLSRDPIDYTVPGILQARILEWVAFPFSRESSQPRDRTQVSHIAGRFFTNWATREAQESWSGYGYSHMAILPMALQFSQHHLLRRLFFKLIDHTHRGLFLSSLFCSIDLYVCFYANLILFNLCIFVILFEISEYDASSFVLPQFLHYLYYYWIVRILYIFWIQVFCELYVLYIISPSLWIAFLNSVLKDKF